MLDTYSKRRLAKQRLGHVIRHRLDREVMPHWRDKPITEIRRSDVTNLIDNVAARTTTGAFSPTSVAC